MEIYFTRRGVTYRNKNLRTNFGLYLIRPFLVGNLGKRHLAKLLPNEDAEKYHKQFFFFFAGNKQFYVTENVKQAIMIYSTRHANKHTLLLSMKTLCKIQRILPGTK
jgi:hypothetical protein